MKKIRNVVMKLPVLLLFGAWALAWRVARDMAWWTFALLCTGSPFAWAAIKGVVLGLSDRRKASAGK